MITNDDPLMVEYWAAFKAWELARDANREARIAMDSARYGVPMIPGRYKLACEAGRETLKAERAAYKRYSTANRALMRASRAKPDS